MAATQNGRSVNPQSRLERLPVEILQKIFFDCLEISLPRASLAIASALSREVIYTWTLRLAFCSDNDSSRTGIFTSPFTPFNMFALTAEERLRLQTAVLECRWCTLPLMRRVQRQYVEHVIARKCKHLVMEPADRWLLENLGDERWARRSEYDQPNNGRRGKGDLALHARDPKTENPLKVAIWFNFGALQIREASTIFHETDMFRFPYCNAKMPCRMPSKLLTPPWTAEKLEFLTLLSTEAYIDGDGDHRRSKAVLAQMIRARDLRTFEKLLALYIRVEPYQYPIRWPSLPNAFRIALRYADGKNDPFVRILYEQRWADLPNHETTLKNSMLQYLGANATY